MPAETNVTAPVEAFTVQTPVVLDVYVFVPLPALGVEVRVGGVAVMLYVDVYDPPSITMVRGASVTVKLTSVAVAAAYVPSEVMVAPMVHVPAATNDTTPVEELIVHTPVVDELYTFVPVPADVVDVMVGGVATMV